MSNIITVGSSHPIALPKRRPMTRLQRPIINVILPSKSKRWLSLLEYVCFIKKIAISNAIIAKGLLKKNTDSQENHSINHPAPIVPHNIPNAWLPVVNPIARPWRFSGKLRDAMAGETA